MWKFVIAWKIPSLISRDQLLEEIDCLTLEIKEKELYWNVEILSRMPTEIRFVEDQSTSTITSTCNAARGGHLELLFEWIWCVVALQSDLYISDFSYDFMDGRVFCSLLSYYYPAVLHPDFQEGLSLEGLNNQVDLGVASNHRVGHNPMKLFIDKMQEGFEGLPPLITEQELIMDDPDGFLDEKIIITLCAHLSRILLAHKDEIRACKVIQRFLRRFINE